jgi:hypothetical protein
VEVSVLVHIFFVSPFIVQSAHIKDYKYIL